METKDFGFKEAKACIGNRLFHYISKNKMTKIEMNSREYNYK